MRRQSTVDPAELRAWVELENLSSEDLDELVYDLCGEDSTDQANQTASEAEQEGALAGGERRASDINNGGLDEQVRFIAAAYPTLSEAKRAIMDSQ